MKIVLEIPEPNFKLKPNEKLVNRGFGWSDQDQFHYAFYDTEARMWHGPRRSSPAGSAWVIYFEVVEVFPMPPEELDGFKLEYWDGSKADIIGKRVAVYYVDRWWIQDEPVQRTWCSNQHYALATPIVDEERDKKLALVAELKAKLAELEGEL